MERSWLEKIEVSEDLGEDMSDVDSRQPAFATFW